MLRGAFGDNLTYDQDVLDWSWDEYNNRVAPCMKMRTEYQWDPKKDNELLDSFYGGLFPFQKACVDFLSHAQCAIFADPMGAGKTVQTIRAIKVSHGAYLGSLQFGLDDVDDPLPIVVVCPDTIKMVWEDEFAKWWPELDTVVVAGNINKRRAALERDADVYILNYEQLRSHSKLGKYGTLSQRHCVVCDGDLVDEKTHPQHRCERCPKELNKMDFGTIVIDEAHRIKEPKAKQTRAAWAVAHKCSYRYALTGTPISDNPSDLWALGHAISPREYPTKTKFLDRYCQRSFNFFGGMEVLGLKPETRDEFFKILDPRFRRLPLEVLLPQLPPVRRQSRRVAMGEKQAKVYREMSRYMAARFETEILTAPNPLTKLMRLMQLASAHATLEIVKNDDDTETVNVTLADPSNKVEALVDLLDETGDEPLVVMSASKQLVNLCAKRLEKEGIAFGCITGDVDTLGRQNVVRQFQGGEIRVVLGTVDAAGEGITLTRANRLVWLMRHWSASKNEQAERRILRIGSERHDFVEYIDIFSAGTVEEYQREVLAGKLERLEEIVRDRETLAKVFGYGAETIL
jgi:SNF2 family DNA or RNA helicase